MKPIIAKVQQSQLRKDHPVFRPGDTIRVHVRLKEGEGDKERIQPFEGVVMSRRGELLGESFTVRRVSFGIGVERIFPVHSPMISTIEVARARAKQRASSASRHMRSRPQAAPPPSSCAIWFIGPLRETGAGLFVWMVLKFHPGFVHGLKFKRGGGTPTLQPDSGN